METQNSNCPHPVQEPLVLPGKTRNKFFSFTLNPLPQPSCGGRQERMEYLGFTVLNINSCSEEKIAERFVHQRCALASSTLIRRRMFALLHPRKVTLKAGTKVVHAFGGYYFRQRRPATLRRTRSWGTSLAHHDQINTMNRISPPSRTVTLFLQRAASRCGRAVFRRIWLIRGSPVDPVLRR